MLVCICTKQYLIIEGYSVVNILRYASGDGEQVLRGKNLLQVLSHLPMSCAIPLQVSALLQPVNKLRFYFVQGKCF